ncbi:hypothetical protein QE152_g1904 [Popillia japonica]|uniref:Uncharacterized protein n=1 Tax=Popillia japonica TaxID=7064 RepID=A0AAW1N4Y1_POPJA
MKRYNPNKPHKCVFLALPLKQFEQVETGKENVVLEEEPDLGASFNVVMRSLRLTESLAKEVILPSLEGSAAPISACAGAAVQVLIQPSDYTI